VVKPSDEQCNEWANIGECEYDGYYMYAMCAAACDSVVKPSDDQCNEWANTGEC